MRHHHSRDGECALQALDLQLHIESQILVERAQRFVKQQNARAHGKRARKRHALLLATRKFARIAILQSRQSHRVDHLAHPRTDRRTVTHVPRLEPVGDVRSHRHMREERVILKYDPDVPFGRAEPADILAVDADLPFRLPHEARQNPQQRTLAAP